MESAVQRRPAMRSPAPPSTSPDRFHSSSKQSHHAQSPAHRPGSSDSDTSQSSNLTALSVVKQRSPFAPQLPSFVSHANHSTTSLSSNSRPSAPYSPQDGTPRKSSALGPPAELQRHRPRQHSQGFFEPSMPSASLASQSALHDHNMPLTASQIAAQAAMQHLSDISHQRKRSSTVPFPQDQIQQEARRGSKGSPSPPLHAPQPLNEQQYRNGLVGTTAATTAANAAFPRSQGHSTPTPPLEEKESKKGLKARFRPKNIGISRDKDKEATKPLPSPNKIPTSGLSKVINASTASLADSLSSNNSSMYALPNPSQSTIIPVAEKDKSHRTGLRQKLKLKDKDDLHAVPVSSASSNSRPTDVNNPQYLYSFAPSSPGPTSTFSKSVSDIRHAGRALRDKKKEEKAHAASGNHIEQTYSRGDSDTSEWPSLQGLGTTLTNQSSVAFTPFHDHRDTLSGFGLNNMTPDDAWDLLKAKLLAVFEGEDVRIAVEDLNRLVSIHIQRCVQKLDPSIIIGDVEDLLRTGFRSLNHTLLNVHDERIVPHLVSMWMQVFGTILPFMQAVFLPLDQEFKGRGAVLTSPKLAAEFWGALPAAQSGAQFSTSPPRASSLDPVVAAGEELEVRRILLISFRDTVILPRFDVLKATFSRLSMDSINATLAHFETTGRDRGNSGGSDRSQAPQTIDPTYSSYSSQTSTLLGTASSGARSRATSNLSNSSNPAQDVAFQSFSSPPAARAGDTSSAQVTETVGRMLQCLSVISSVQSGDEAQGKMEELNKQLKLNWLGRGRTGRNRKGFVGSRVRPPRSIGSTIKGEREGSPTPTPTRQGTVSRQVEDGERDRGVATSSGTVRVVS